jgi:RNA polymerase sigma-70 factor, ECF subfamily
MTAQEKITSNEFKAVSSKLIEYSRTLCKNDYDAQDLYQDTIVKVIENYHLYVEDKNLKSWCKMIMKNTFINQYRKRLTQPNIDLYNDKGEVIDMAEIAKVKEGVGNEAIGIMTYDEVMKHIDNLPKRLKHVYIDYLLEDMSNKDIADKHQLNIKTARSRVHRAKKALYATLGPLYNSDGVYKRTIQKSTYRKKMYGK